MLNDVTVKWKLGRRRQENDPRYVHSEAIQITALLTSLGNELLLERVRYLNLEEWLKYGVTTKR